MSRVVFKRVTENQLADRDNKVRLDAKMEGNINGVLLAAGKVRDAAAKKFLSFKDEDARSLRSVATDLDSFAKELEGKLFEMRRKGAAS